MLLKLTATNLTFIYLASVVEKVDWTDPDDLSATIILGYGSVCGSIKGGSRGIQFASLGIHVLGGVLD